MRWIKPEPNPTHTHKARPILYPYMKVTATYIMLKVYNHYNGRCYDLEHKRIELNYFFYGLELKLF